MSSAKASTHSLLGLFRSGNVAQAGGVGDMRDLYVFGEHRARCDGRKTIGTTVFGREYNGPKTGSSGLFLGFDLDDKLYVVSDRTQIGLHAEI